MQGDTWDIPMAALGGSLRCGEGEGEGEIERVGERERKRERETRLHSLHLIIVANQASATSPELHDMIA